ncbi:hypothetical protein Syun_004958 [Stephania yunnanensis]|uniref:Uncharacterized protein n=1 Tax=Stephania yunnanensis TaxID=152371 RepID=A0AAP0L4D5_9MAGN
MDSRLHMKHFGFLDRTWSALMGCLNSSSPPSTWITLAVYAQLMVPAVVAPPFLLSLCVV